MAGGHLRGDVGMASSGHGVELSSLQVEGARLTMRPGAPTSPIKPPHDLHGGSTTFTQEEFFECTDVFKP